MSRRGGQLGRAYVGDLCRNDPSGRRHRPDPGSPRTCVVVPVDPHHRGPPAQPRRSRRGFHSEREGRVRGRLAPPRHLSGRRRLRGDNRSQPCAAYAPRTEAAIPDRGRPALSADALITLIDGVNHRDAVTGSVRFFVWKHLWFEAGKHPPPPYPDEHAGIATLAGVVGTRCWPARSSAAKAWPWNWPWTTTRGEQVPHLGRGDAHETPHRGGGAVRGSAP
jgi:hypothetical protein